MKPFVVTLFGAESTGKTTLSKALAREFNALWIEEFARPYLEQTGEDITISSMKAIWQGQKALQALGVRSNHRLIMQDTDLFSTVGYWQLPHIEPTLGACPTGLIHDAESLRSDLYLVVTSNIPFAKDPLRYGGDHRESPDSYWIRLCEKYSLNYQVIAAANPTERLKEAVQIIKERNPSCAD